MGRAKLIDHVHARNYWGELDAKLVIKWLNSKTKPAHDSIEMLVQLNAQLTEPDLAQDLLSGTNAAQKINSEVHKLVSRSKLAVAPSLHAATAQGWEITWGIVGNMPPDKGLAFINLLHLAEKGVLASVKRCAWRECRCWFFARFLHQEFCSTRCQQRAAHSTQTWKDMRKRYMKDLRRTMRLREARGLKLSKRKGK